MQLIHVEMLANLIIVWTFQAHWGQSNLIYQKKQLKGSSKEVRQEH